MAININTARSTLNQADVLHLARRAGFGMTPEQATAFIAAHGGGASGQLVDDWIDGTGIDRSAFTSALPSADPVSEGGQDASNGGVAQAATPGPHPYMVQGQYAYRNSFSRAQAFLTFRMQYDPYPYPERMALFLHNLFATGWSKVDNAALMLNQWDLLTQVGKAAAAQGAQDLAIFDNILVEISKDPAMLVWLDSVRNNARNGAPNENYAREVMELYSLGVDNGYNQNDITELAVALGGWNFSVAPGDVSTNPANPEDRRPAKGTFRVYDGGTLPAGELRWDLNENVQLPNMRNDSVPLTYLGTTFSNVGAPPAGQAKGEPLIRQITKLRGTQSATFLARRLLTHFVTTQFTADEVSELAAFIVTANFDLRVVMKALLKSEYFYSDNNRFALVEGPVSWMVRAAKLLGKDVSAAANYPAWALAVGAFDNLGMKLLDPNGPNGWKEDTAWLNSNTVRYRTRVAAAVALAETTNYQASKEAASKTYTIFPTDPATWFTTAPTNAGEVMARLLELLQPGTIPVAVRQSWQAALFTGTFDWSTDATKRAARALAFLILCSPGGQVY
ncbi:MAG: DUF1800 family protein [Anaeromyxobacter sp.]